MNEISCLLPLKVLFSLLTVINHITVEKMTKKKLLSVVECKICTRHNNVPYSTSPVNTNIKGPYVTVTTSDLLATLISGSLSTNYNRTTPIHSHFTDLDLQDRKRNCISICMRGTFFSAWFLCIVQNEVHTYQLR